MEKDFAILLLTRVRNGMELIEQTMNKLHKTRQR
jgi:hypothetical protein